MNYFNDNFWTIVADEENMCKVMELFWQNLASYPEVITELASEPPKGASADELYESISWYLRNSLYLACENDIKLTPNGDGTYSVDYPLPLSGGTGFTVSYDAYGGLRVFSASYYTKFTEHTEMMSAFEDRLPLGEYGLATLCSVLTEDDEDELFGIGAIYSRGGGWEGDLPHRGGEFQEEETSELFDVVVAMEKSQLDLKDIAYLFCLAEWRPAECDSNTLRSLVLQEGEFNSPVVYDQRESMVYSNWEKAGEISLLKVWPELLRELTKFPFTMNVIEPADRERRENIGTLIAGDTVILRSDWESPHFSPVGVEAFTEDGRPIGELGDDDSYEPDFYDDTNRLTFALMLPHIHAVVQEVSPEYSYILVRLDLDQLDWVELKQEVEVLLVQAPNERARESLPKANAAEASELSLEDNMDEISMKAIEKASDSLSGSFEGLIACFQEAFGEDAVLPGSVLGNLLPGGIKGIDLLQEVELRETVLVVSSATFVPAEGTLLNPIFHEDGWDGVSIEFSVVGDDGKRFVLPPASDFNPFLEGCINRADSLLSEYQCCTVVSVDSSSHDPCFFQVRLRFLHELEADTLLYALIQAGLIPREQLQKKDEPSSVEEDR